MARRTGARCIGSDARTSTRALTDSIQISLPAAGAAGLQQCKRRDAVREDTFAVQCKPIAEHSAVYAAKIDAERKIAAFVEAPQRRWIAEVPRPDVRAEREHRTGSTVIGSAAGVLARPA